MIDRHSPLKREWTREELDVLSDYMSNASLKRFLDFVFWVDNLDAPPRDQSEIYSQGYEDGTRDAYARLNVAANTTPRDAGDVVVVETGYGETLRDVASAPASPEEQEQG